MNKKAFASSSVLVLGLVAWFAVMIEFFMIFGLTKNNIIIFVITMLLICLACLMTWIIYGKIKDQEQFHSDIEFEFHEFEGQIIIKFNQPTNLIMLPPDQALDLGRILIKRGKKLVNKESKKGKVK